MLLQVLIVDDEAIIAHELKNMLEQLDDNLSIRLCHSGVEAMQEVESRKIDLVFLDIQMPGINGMQVAQVWASKEKSPIVVFVTAYSEYALDAFAVDALDYLLKPFDEDDIERVLKKVNRYYKRAKSDEKNIRKEIAQRFSVEGSNGFNIIDSKDILYIQAKDRLVYLHTIDRERHLAKLTLHEFEQRLDPTSFFRCHRNYIVNIAQIYKVTTWFNRGYLLVLKGKEKTEVPVSRLYVRDLKERLLL